MDDPGWRGTFRLAIPIYGHRMARRHRGHGITTLRAVFVSFASAVVLFGGVVAYTADWDPPSIAPLAVIAVLGAVALVIVRALRRSPLDTTSAVAPADSFVTRFFLMIGVSELVAVIGFGLTFAVDRAQLYWAAAAFTLIGFRVAAPDRTEVTRRQDEIATSGSSLSLLEALENRRSS